MTYTPAYGRLPKTPDPRDYRATAPRKYTGEFIDLSGGFPDPPYDQGQLGSCVANGTAGAVDYARSKMGLEPLRPPSRLFIYYEGRRLGGYPVDQDSGLQIRDGFTVIAKDGAPPESDWPYDISRFAQKPPAQAYSDAQLDQAVVYGQVGQGSSVDDMIASGYPVVFGFDVYESFESTQLASTGIMPIPNTRRERNIGGHCVVVCSTPKDGAEVGGVAVPGRLYRKCRNSWGHDGSWGLPDEPGYFWFPVDVMDGQEASDFWQVTTVEDSNKPTPPDPTPPPDGRPFLVASDLADRLDRAAARNRLTPEQELDHVLRRHFNMPVS